MSVQNIALKAILFALPQALRFSAKRHAVQAEAMKRHDSVVQIQLKDGSIGRWYAFSSGRITTGAGVRGDVDVRILFKDVATAVRLLTPPVDRAEAVHAAKNFQVLQIGPDHLVQWFHEMINNMTNLGVEYGTKMPDGTTRYTTNRQWRADLRLCAGQQDCRITPIDFKDKDAPSWTIDARNKSASRRVVRAWSILMRCA